MSVPVRHPTARKMKHGTTRPRRRAYAVSATVNAQQVPMFYLLASEQGIVNKQHAVGIALDILVSLVDIDTDSVRESVAMDVHEVWL